MASAKRCVHNIGAVYMAGKIGFFLIGGWGLNVANTLALEKYRELGFVRDGTLLRAERGAYPPAGRQASLRRGELWASAADDHPKLPREKRHGLPPNAAKSSAPSPTARAWTSLWTVKTAAPSCSMGYRCIWRTVWRNSREFASRRCILLGKPPQQIRRIIEAYRHRYGRGEAGFSEKEFTRGALLPQCTVRT